MKEPTIFIIDDDPSVRKGLTRLVTASGMNTESFASARDFLDSENLDSPGCIILDVQMPGMTGPELQEELGNTSYGLPIIFLSAHGDVPTTANAMKKGAVDFLTKPVDGPKLLETIRISLEKDTENRRQRKISSEINAQINLLTAREFEVMTWVITGMLNKQIAGEMDISEETVKIHRGRVMHKLEIVSVAELVRICEKIDIVPAKTDIK
jgi:FixJ family two-component response regulator